MANCELIKISEVIDLIDLKAPILKNADKLSEFIELKLGTNLLEYFTYLKESNNTSALNELIEAFDYYEIPINDFITDVPVSEIGFKNAISSNLRSSEVTDLFHTMSVAKNYFEQQMIGRVIGAITVGDVNDDRYVNNGEALNTNIKSLKEELFQTLLNYVGMSNPTLKLYKEDGKFNEDAYGIFKNAVKTLETKLYDETTRESYNGRKIPNLRGSILNEKDRQKFDAYNAAIMLINFDNVIKKLLPKVLKVDYSVFNKFNDSVANAFKYSLKADGEHTVYWSKGDHESESIEKLEDSLTKYIVSTIPQRNKQNKPTGQFLEMKDFYSLGGIFKELELNNWATFIEDSTWMPFQEDSKKMVSWYLEKILVAKANNFLNEEDKKYSIFSSKMELVYSLDSFIKDNNILVKEKNSKNFSVLATLGQVINNTYGASYLIYDTEGKYTVQEMHKHNASVIATQNGIYRAIVQNINQAKDLFSEEAVEKLFKFNTTLPSSNIIEQNNGEFYVKDSSEYRTFANKFRKFMFNRLGFNISLNTLNDVILGMDSSTGQNKGDLSLNDLKGYVNTLFQTVLTSTVSDISENEEKISKGERNNIKTETEALSSILSNNFLREAINKSIDNGLPSKTIMMIHTLAGNSIPTFKTATLLYNDVALLSSHHKNYNKNNDKYYKSLLLNKKGVVLGTGTKLEIRDEQDSKEAAKMNLIENFNTTVLYDFFKSFDKDKKDGQPTFGVTLGNYSDKSTILAKLISCDAETHEGELIKNLPNEKLVELFRLQNKNYYVDITNDIFKQFEYLFKNNGSIKKFEKLDFNGKVKFINDYLVKTDADGKNLFQKEKKQAVFSGANFVDELHYSSYVEKGKKRLALNQLIVDNYNIFSDNNEGEANESYKKFIQMQEDNLISKYLKASDGSTEIQFRSTDDISNAYDNLKLTNTQGSTQHIYDGEITKLNPLVKKWLWTTNLFKNEYMYVSAKGEYMHPHKNKNLEFRGNNPEIKWEDLELEMHGRLASMAKRNVLFTATIELPNRNTPESVPNFVNMAIIDDMGAQIYNQSGSIKNGQDIHDGSSVINYVYSKLIEKSYPGKSYNGTKKQFATFLTDYSCVVKKDAETVITNDKIRNSNHSPVKFRDKQKQVFTSHQLNGIRYIKDSVDNLFVQENGIRKQITSYVINKGNINITYNNNINDTAVKKATTLFDVWEALGGEYSSDENDVFSEGSNDELFDLVVDKSLKEDMIHIISNKSAVKAGATNINTDNSWTNNETLMFTRYENKHCGPQLDANHEADASKIKEITQVVSALSQNGNTAHLAQEVYDNLAKVIEIAAKPYDNYMRPKKDAEGNEVENKDLYEFMSRKFIDKVSKEDGASLAKSILESLPKELQIPFSNQNFFQKFTKEVISRMNNEFITRYYKGIGAVLNPSHGMIQMFEDINGNLLKQDDMAKLAFADYTTTTHLESTDNIIFGHPGIGKTYAAEKMNNIIDFDSQYKPAIKLNIANALGINIIDLTSDVLNKFKENDPRYIGFLDEAWEKAKQDAKSKNKKLYASDMLTLQNHASDFDKFINLDKDTFVQRSIQRNDYNDFTETWKDKIDVLLNNVDQSKIIQTNKYLYDLLNVNNGQIIKDYLDKIHPPQEIHVDQFQPGDSYLTTVELDVADFEGESHKETHNVVNTLDTIEKYYEFKEKYKDQMVVKSFSTPRDLKPSEITFNLLGKAKNIFDTDSIRLRYVLNTIKDNVKLIKDGKEPKFVNETDFKILSNFAKSFGTSVNDFGQMDKLLNAWTQRNLQFLDHKNVMNPVNETTIFEKYFGGLVNGKFVKDDLLNNIFEDVRELYTGKLLPITDYKFKAAELILPNIYKSDFGTGIDSIHEIRNNPDYFKNKLIDQFNVSDDESDFIIVLGKDENPIHVVYTSDLSKIQEKEDIITDKEVVNGKLTNVRIRLNSKGEKLYTIPENAKVAFDKDTNRETLYILAASKHVSNKTNKEFYKIDLQLGRTVENLIKSFNGEIQAIVPTMNSMFKTKEIDGKIFNSDIQKVTLKAFGNFIGKKVDMSTFNANTAKEWFEGVKMSMIDDIATKRKISWEKSHEFVVARIPSQSMQSFMAMQNVGYNNTDSNDAYVSIWQIWLQGSDFDIDKAYTVGYGFNKNGQYES